MRKFLCLVAIILGDLAALGLAFILTATLARRAWFPFSASAASPQWKGFLVASVIILTGFFFEKLYIRRFSYWSEVRRIIKTVSLAFILILALVYLSRSEKTYLPAFIPVFFVLTMVFIPFFRQRVKRLLARTMLWRKKVLILGTGKTALLVARGILQNPSLGYDITGFLSVDNRQVGATLAAGRRVLGTLRDLEAVQRREGIQDIIMALPDMKQNRIAEIVEKGERFCETIRIVPAIGGMFTIGVEAETWGEVLSLSIARNLVKPWNIVFKRIFDLVLTSILLAVLSPLLLVLAVAVRLDSPGSVFFRQKRLTLKKKQFWLLKFRSMHLNSEDRFRKHLEQNPDARREWDKFKKIRRGDPRLTRVGRFIRRFSLDELPQLWNILRGDMSLVGPRPYLPAEIRSHSSAFLVITRVRPGLTGLWQVSGRSRLSFKERLQWDEYYIRNWSFWLDVVILLKTFKVLARGEGA